MDWWRQLLFRLRALFRRQHFEADMAEEMRVHLEIETERNRAEGMVGGDARFAAQRQFGGVEQIKERARDECGWMWLNQSMQDVRFAARSLRKNPGFAAVTIVTLALGIGATTAIFSVVHGVLLQPLDYPDAEQLVVIRETNPPRYREASVSPPNFLDWEKQMTVFASLTAHRAVILNLTGDGEPQRLSGVKATARYFETYGIKPALGRTFLPEEDMPGKDRVAVLSFALWQRLFGGATDVIGRSLQLDGESFAVIGVTPAGFTAANAPDLWVPMAFVPPERLDGNRGSHYIGVIGRLKPGVTVAQAEAEIKLIAAQIAEQHSRKGWSALVAPLLDYNVRGVKATLYTLLGAVGCVLLIACANIANLLLARATARHREFAARVALGAGRTRLVRQLLTESLVLALLGGAAGILLARWSLETWLIFAPPDLPRRTDVQLDAGVLTVSLALTLFTGLVVGAVPAWLAARTDLNEALKQGARGATEGRGRGRLRGSLVVLQVAFTLVLLAGAGLLVRSFAKLARVNPGFMAENAAVLRLTLPAKKYPTTTQQLAFADALLARLSALPGVQAAGLTHSLPLVGRQVNTIAVEGQPAPSPTEKPVANYYAVTPGYFRAMGIRLVRGRFFLSEDDARAPRVVLVNETFARQQFPHEDPIGRRINIANGPDAWREIVGVVGDVSQSGLDQATPAQCYEPFAQKPFTSPGLNFIVRTTGSPAAVLGALRPAVYAVDKDQPVDSIRPLTDFMADSLSRQRFATFLLGSFSTLALVIAAIGIYGVMAYTVSQRRGEIGVRVALGAQAGDVLRLVLAQGGRLIGLGLLLGLTATLAGGRAIESMLYQTTPHDPVTLAGITLLLATVAFLACLVPACRATKVDPMVALRCE